MSLSIFSGEGAYLDYSNLPPWTVLYTIYPVYKLDPWVQIVWKNERSLDISTNILKNNHGEETKLNIQEKTVQINDSHQKSTLNDNKNENQDENLQQKIETQLWPIYFVSS